MLIPVGLLTAAAVAVPAILGGDPAFASWTAIPEPIPPSDAQAAATTCRMALGISEQGARVVIGERRGGWTYVLLDGPAGEAACLMPDDIVGANNVADRRSGFFGSYDPTPWTHRPPRARASSRPRARVAPWRSAVASG